MSSLCKDRTQQCGSFPLQIDEMEFHYTVHTHVDITNGSVYDCVGAALVAAESQQAVYDRFAAVPSSFRTLLIHILL